MPKGGSRQGAGRPRGSRGKRTKDSIARAEALGPTPLEVLLESMLEARAQGQRAEAVDCAKAAAPYVHPKLAPSAAPPASGSVCDEMDLGAFSDAELEQFGNLLEKSLNRPAGERSPAEREDATSAAPRPVKRYARYGRSMSRGS